MVEFPVTSRVDKSKYSLADALNQFPEGDYSIVMRSDQHNQFFIERVESVADVIHNDDIHAKAVITEDIIYMGSANITRSGVEDNIELARVVENEYGNVDEFIEEELFITV